MPRTPVKTGISAHNSTLHSRTAATAEPGINRLQVETAQKFDKGRILSNSQPARRRHAKPAPQALQDHEITALFSVITDPRDRAIFRVAYHAGLRASEVGMLQMRDWDPSTQRLNTRRLKGSHSGQHRMVREEARVLRAWLKERGNAPGPLFPSNRRRGIGRAQLHVLMRQYAAAAGIPIELAHFHVLKHSCVTHLLERGANIEMAQDWVGHADVRNTQKYTHISNRRRDEMAATLQDWK